MMKEIDEMWGRKVALYEKHIERLKSREKKELEISKGEKVHISPKKKEEHETQTEKKELKVSESTTQEKEEEKKELEISKGEEVEVSPKKKEEHETQTEKEGLKLSEPITVKNEVQEKPSLGTTEVISEEMKRTPLKVGGGIVKERNRPEPTKVSTGTSPEKPELKLTHQEEVEVSPQKKVDQETQPKEPEPAKVSTGTEPKKSELEVSEPTTAEKPKEPEPAKVSTGTEPEPKKPELEISDPKTTEKAPEPDRKDTLTQLEDEPPETGDPQHEGKETLNQLTRFYPDERSEVEEEDDQEAAVEKILLDADHQGLTRDKVQYLESLFKVPPDQFYIDLEELTYEEGKYVRERFRRYLKEVVMRYPMAAHLTVDFDLGDQWVRYNLSKPEVMEKIREFLDNDNNFKIMFELESLPEDYQYQNDYTLPPLRIVNKIQFSRTKWEYPEGVKKEGEEVKKSFKDRGGGFLEYLLPDYTAKEFEEVMKRYQVFTRLTKKKPEQSEEKREGENVLREELDDNCFIWALKQANIPEDVLNRMRLRVRTRYTNYAKKQR